MTVPIYMCMKTDQKDLKNKTDFDETTLSADSYLKSVGPALGKAGLFRHFLPDAGSLLVVALCLPQLGLVALDGLLGLGVGLVGVVQGDLELVDVALELLLDAQSLGLGALLGLERGLHRVHGAGVVLPENRFFLV